jgi:hypothetical protein
MATVISGDTGVNRITDGSIVDADIGAGEITDAKLASTLDLSGKTMTYGNLPAANLTGTLPALDGSNLTGVSGGPVIKYVTDSTDISVTTAANVGQHNLGSTFSVDIPTSGSFELKQVVMRWRNDAADYGCPTFGLRIGSTNYWFGLEESTTDGVEIVPFALAHNSTLNEVSTMYSGPGCNVLFNGNHYGSNPVRDIVQSGIPTGTQTVQLVVAKPDFSASYGTSNWTILGTSLTTRVAIQFTEYS